MLVAGIDSSTQSTKVVLCRAEDGQVVGQGSAPHPAGTEATRRLVGRAAARPVTACSAAPRPWVWPGSSTE